MRRAASEDGIALVEAPNGSDLHAQALRLREAILRRPLGLALTEEEITDDAGRRHFCAMAHGAVVGSLSLKPLGPHTLQLRQMAVARDRQREGIGTRLLAYAEDWARRSGYGVIILNARVGADGFYSRLGYQCEGEVFEENTIPHIRMTKRLG